MNADALLTALDLPVDSRVDQRVPKKLLLENGAPTAADKRYINEGIEEFLWLAALKPTTIGVPEYRDDSREYLEVAVLQMTLRSTVNAKRLVELVHRAVPYPVLLLTERGETPSVSAAHKRWSLGEAGKSVLEGEVIAVEWQAVIDGERWNTFGEAMSLGRQPRASLFILYQGWIDTLLAMQAARVTGIFALAGDAAQAAARSDALRQYSQLEDEIARLRIAATKETQVARQVALNLQLKRMEAAQSAARARL